MAHEHLARVNKDRIALADELVKSWRSEGMSEDEIVLRLRETFRPKLAQTIFGELMKRRPGTSIDFFGTGNDGTRDTPRVRKSNLGGAGLPSGRADVTKVLMGASAREDETDEQRLAAIREQIRQDERTIR
jgi:hypothetical protein